jgi:hypothetical protein
MRGPSEFQRMQLMAESFELRSARQALAEHLSAGNTTMETEATLKDLEANVKALEARVGLGLFATFAQSLRGLFGSGPVSTTGPPASAPAASAGTGAQPAAGAVSGAGGVRNEHPLSQVNPTGGTTNCVNCALSLDATLSGAPSCAMPGCVTSPRLLQQMYGRGFYGTTSGHLTNELRQAGNGARGIVLIPGTPNSHVINAINQGGVVKYLDGQIGREVTAPSGPIFFLRTNQGRVSP